MSDAQPEISVLWRGEWVIREWLARDRMRMSEDDCKALDDLLEELFRIRKMRVARWQARHEAKRKKRQAQIAQAQRADRRVRELLDRSTQRDQANGLSP